MSFTGGIDRISSQDLLSDTIRFERFGREEGLSSSLVHSMIEDKEGRLWVISENVLSVYNPRTRLFVNYASSLFKSRLKFSEAIPLPMPDSTFMVGTNQGTLQIFPSRLGTDHYVPTVVFTDVRIQGQALQANLNKMSRLVLSPSQRNLMCSFSAIDMLSSQDIRYAYRLKGLEKEWNEVGKSRTASYMNLPDGKYVLEVKSTNSNGVWMDNTRRLELVVKPTFGETVWALLLYVLLFAALTALIVYISFYIYRLRHRINLEKQLADIKLRFFTDISHELRTPLTLISGPVDEVLHDRTLSPQSRELLTLVHNNVNRMLRLMTQILDFRKIQNKKMKLVVEETPLVPFLHEQMGHFHSLSVEQRISFHLQADDPGITLWLDRDKADKIFFNLISNAFKYTPAGKSIHMQVERKGDRVEVSVSDEGIGIEAEKKDRLFQLFENFAKAKTGSGMPSSGIGLSLVKELVELHHGIIRVESTPGVGSRFTVSLPLGRTVYDEDKDTEFILADSRESVSEEPMTAESQPLPAEDENRLTVLVVEDNDELRRFLVSILSGEYRVIEARNGEEGLEMASSEVPHLIITDVMMPVMDGLEMVRRLKQDRNVCHIPLIVLSAKASLDDRITGLEAGIDDYIIKPFSSTYLRTRIASLLKRQKQLQEVFMERLQAKLPTAVGGTAHHHEGEEVVSPPNPVTLDEQFVQQVVAYLEEHLSDPSLKIEDFAAHLCLSRTVFYRKLKTITGLTPVEFVREVRLQHAIRLMADNAYTVAQVAYMTGFGDPNYFGRCFKKKMGVTPTEYKEKGKKG